MPGEATLSKLDSNGEGAKRTQDTLRGSEQEETGIDISACKNPAPLSGPSSNATPSREFYHNLGSKYTFFYDSVSVSSCHRCLVLELVTAVSPNSLISLWTGPHRRGLPAQHLALRYLRSQGEGSRTWWVLSPSSRVLLLQGRSRTTCLPGTWTVCLEFTPDLPNLSFQGWSPKSSLFCFLLKLLLGLPWLSSG